jgi:aminoglycoside phosphotransferase (APT) family kinase protein
MFDFTTERAQLIVDKVEPGLRLVAVSPAYGAFTNEGRILDCRTPAGNDMRLVVKLLTDDPEDAARRAAADFHGLKVARAHDIPAPEQILLDETGEVLGVPGIVTRFVEGRQIAGPETLRRGRRLSRTSCSAYTTSRSASRNSMVCTMTTIKGCTS